MKTEAYKKLVVRFSQPSLGESVILRGQNRAEISGCRKILSYTPRKISLLVGNKRLILVGRDMVCASFSSDALWIKGKIIGIFYPLREERA